MKQLKSLKAFILFLLVGLAATQNTIAADKNASAQNEDREFIELSHTDIKPPFSQPTVLKLNAIVRRSYDAINEFDSIVEDTRVTVSKASDKTSKDKQLKEVAQKKMKKIFSLQNDSKIALKDILAAASQLRQGKEEYNNAILEGMIQFCEEVEQEITAEKAYLKKLINNAA